MPILPISKASCRADRPCRDVSRVRSRTGPRRRRCRRRARPCWRDLDAAVKARDLDAAKDANRKIQTRAGCNPLRIDAKAAMLGLYQREDDRLEKAGASPAQRLAALKAALVSYGTTMTGSRASGLPTSSSSWPRPAARAMRGHQPSLLRCPAGGGEEFAVSRPHRRRPSWSGSPCWPISTRPYLRRP